VTWDYVSFHGASCFASRSLWCSSGQGTSTSDGSCPGDDFGHPAYFGLSVRYITQSAIISSAASHAG